MTMTMTHSKKDLRHSQETGSTDMSNGVITPEKDSVKVLNPCSSSKTDIIPLYKDSGQCLQETKKQAIALTSSSEFNRALLRNCTKADPIYGILELLRGW